MNKVLLVAALTVLASNAHALTVIVPDDIPTIQAAINRGADSVRVRSGLYAEALEITRSVVIVPFPAPIGFGYNAVALPRVAGLTIKESHSGTATVVIQGLRFTRPVILDRESGSQMYLTFQACRMDSGLVERAISSGYFGIVVLNVHGCTIFGGARARPHDTNFTLNTFVGGGLDAHGEGYSTIKGNFVQGPAEVGIRSSGEYCYVEDNTIVGTVIGLDARWHVGYALRNEILDCSGHGINGPAGGVFTENVIRRCVGNGINIEGEVHGGDVVRNVVEQSGGAGIRLVQGNVVKDNVVARSGGPGIVTGMFCTVTGNTSYANQGPGFVAEYGDIERNIAFANGGAGLQWSENEPRMKCNDWFGNARGAVQGMTRMDGPGPTDISVDPLFCDANVGDVHLRSDSPLVDAPGCGLIGALGVGCGLRPALAVETDDSPSPGFGVRLRGQVAFVTLDEQGPAALDLLDVAGRRLSRILITGSREVALDQPAGVYFLRLTQGARTASIKAVVMQ